MKTLELDRLFYDISTSTNKYMHFERLVFLGKWLWMIPYLFISAITGILHSYFYERRFEIKYIALTSFIVYCAELIKCSFPYGTSAMVIYLFDFIKKFYNQPIPIFAICFIGLFIGTEAFVIWIKNIGADNLLSRYK